MKKITTNEQMNINGGAHYHWRCYFGGHNYKSVARTNYSAIRWRDYHNTKYHSGERKAKLGKACNRSCGKVYDNLP